MKVAVEGCAHGELDKIYEAVKILEKENNMKIDLLIICGDFQAVRNPADLHCMAVPPKYRKLNTFYKYYSGAKIAPVLTIFIGGNHEASNYLSELSYGGWVCPNIFYMGYANVINVGGIRIAGLSGIYKGRDYLRGHFECPPYEESSKKSVYHVRNIDVFRLKQIKSPIDICISHDWPRTVYNYGNKEDILRWKPFFREEMENNKLGSQPAEELLYKLKPAYWFSAHLHCKFAAVIPHQNSEGTMYTKFLALDKCLPRRNYLQVLEIGNKSEAVDIKYDPEWLCILQTTDHLLNTSKTCVYMPGPGGKEKWDYTPSKEDIQRITELFKGDFKVPNNFSVTAPTYDNSQTSNDFTVKNYINPQTTSFCNILNITDPFAVVCNSDGESLNTSGLSSTGLDFSFSTSNADEISLSDIEDATEVLSPKNDDLDVSDSTDFFIDTVGSNMSPNVQKFLKTQHCSTPIPKFNIDSDFHFPEIKEENINSEKRKSDEEEQPVKVFKRRNWSLYKSEEDGSA
ncbi:lariat debranching enzyme-like isoform X2 [Stegodyphus dumicola]|uniref:lariat debranching enzyme-like isoform X1 n=1 Tax=Stegodyphus dumicola TaxID=202533 RepID=UPI0015A99B13|nr:lariat debranching enzyme-like isoform X1 [Stegodyphus dumicola]XP_035221990.1 lariat debranching enzyme-like isoform X2 [Stegodyphus dumicola]